MGIIRGFVVVGEDGRVVVGLGPMAGVLESLTGRYRWRLCKGGVVWAGVDVKRGG